MASASRHEPPASPTVRLQDASLPYLPSPPIAPEGIAARELTAAMARHLLLMSPRSDAETLRALRTAFPDSPLTLRVAALDLIQRGRGG